MNSENLQQRLGRTAPFANPIFPTPEVEEAFSLLMSMALDDLLAVDEQDEFDRYLATYPTLAREWQDWQMLDSQLKSTPAIQPPADFMLNFEMRLVQHERRRNLRWGMAFGSVAVLLWVAAMVSVASLGAFVLLGQPGWLTQAVHDLAYVSANAGAWMTAAGSALTSILSTQQAMTLAMVYILVSVAMVASWVYFLRHSTRPANMTSSV